MKKIFAYTIIALLGLCASCMSNEGDEKVAKVVFEIDNDKIAVSPDGGDFVITIRTNESWTLKAQEGSEWCVPAITEGEANLEGIAIPFSVDMTYDDREAIFWFEVRGMSRQLVVTQKAKAVVFPDENNEFNIPAEGRIARVEFESTYPCTVLIPTEAQGWVQEVPTSRGMESYYIDLNIKANNNYEARQTTVKVAVVGSEDVYAEYTIKQAQKNAILPGEDNTFNVGADGDIIEIMFETNIAWEVVISEEGKDWIVMPEATRALREECVELQVLANEEYSARSATLMIVGVEDDTLFAEYTVNQAQRDAVIADENNRYIVAPQGGEIEIAFETNVDCEVVIPEDVEWIEIVVEESTRSLESKSVKLVVAENDTYAEREAVVRVEKVGDSELYAEYIVVQRQNDALFTDGDTLIKVQSTGGEAEVAYRTNVACKVVIPEDVEWISVKEATRALQQESAVLVIAPNDTYEARTAVVDVVMVDNEELVVSYTITQAQMNGIVLDGDRVEATVDGGIVDLGYSANVDCEVIIPEDCDWVSIAPETRGLEARNLSLLILANDAFEARETVVTLSGEGIDREITIAQEAKRLDVAITEYEVSTEASTIEVAVDANIDYDVVIAEGCDWISVANVEGNPSHSLLLLAVAENETIYERSAEVVLKHGDREVVLMVKQGADEALLNVDQEYVVEGGETEVVVELESNFSYRVIIPEECDWVELPATRRAKVQSSVVRFMVHRNPTVLDRYVDIEFADERGTLSKVVRITQRGSHLMDLFEVKDNEILYITTDGNILKPNNSIFGSNMLDNIYENGYGRIVFTDAVKQLGDKVFENCATIKQIILPNSIESIGNDVFKGCSLLEDIVIPQGVKSIGSSAFRNSGITNITFAEGSVLESIAASAFYGCKGVSSVIIPEGVKSIGNSAFSNCVNVKAVTLPQSVESLGTNIFGGCKNLESIVIPNGVKLVPDCAFLNCSNLQQVVLGEGIEEIYMSAFSGCTSLCGMTFPDNIRVVGDSAFYNCRSLTEIIFSETSQLTTIGKNAFKDCTSVERVVIPAGVENIGESAFAGCGGALVVNANIADATITSGAYYGSLFASVVIGDAVTAIGDYAFYGQNTIESLTLGSNIEHIGENAFGGCGAIKTVELPEGVKSIGKSAFNGCNAVERVVIPASVETIGESAFVGCGGELLLNANVADGTSSTTGTFSGTTFSRVVVGDDVTAIGDYAFAGCATIAELSLGENLEHIGDSAFAGCNALEVVEMPASVKTIGDGIFADCENLSRVVLSEAVTTISNAAFSGCTHLADVVATGAVVAIGDEAFKGCASLADFTLPASVESIGDSAFYGCATISDVTMPASVMSVGDSAFEGCTSLASVTLSEALTAIGDRTFAGCSTLSDVVIPKNVVTIGASAFEECDALIALVVFEDSKLTTIGSSAFSGCDTLARVDIPASIIAIEDGAFIGCVNLAEVALGEAMQLTTIGDSAFEGCTYVQSVVLPASLTDIGTSAFVGCGGELTMNANIASGASEAEGIFCGTHFKSVVIGEGVTTIGDYAFAGCATIENMAIGSTVTALGKGAFKDCAMLPDVNIPAGIATIGDDAYYGCSSIKSVDLGEATQLTTIGKGAFNGCTAVERVVIPASVTTIGSSAFVGCGGELAVNANIGNGASETSGVFYGTNFSNVVIGEGVTTIGDYAFAGCATIENAAIASTVTALGKGAFKDCALLSEAAIPAGVTQICDVTYSGCISLESVTFGAESQLATLGKEAFKGCSKIKYLSLPNGVTTLGESVFAECTSIVTAIMGENMAQIGSKAFNGCGSLNIVYSNALVPPAIGSDVFGGCSSMLTIYVPKDSVKDYHRTKGWSNYKSIIIGAE